MVDEIAVHWSGNSVASEQEAGLKTEAVECAAAKGRDAGKSDSVKPSKSMALSAEAKCFES